MAVGLEQGGETFGLLVDAVGEVLRPAVDTHEAVPVNLDPRWRGLASGVHRLPARSHARSMRAPGRWRASAPPRLGRGPHLTA